MRGIEVAAKAGVLDIPKVQRDRICANSFHVEVISECEGLEQLVLTDEAGHRKFVIWRVIT